MSGEARVCVNKACGKNTFGQNDSCPFCGTKQPNKIKRGSTANQRALDKGASVGLAQFAAVELGAKPGAKPRARASAPEAEPEAAIEAEAAEAVPAAAVPGEEGEESPAAAPVKKAVPVNAAGMALAAALKGGVPKKGPPKAE